MDYEKVVKFIDAEIVKLEHDYDRHSAHGNTLMSTAISGTLMTFGIIKKALEEGAKK